MRNITPNYIAKTTPQKNDEYSSGNVPMGIVWDSYLLLINVVYVKYGRVQNVVKSRA
jgi:hypothetical protein